jgi:hypothetical protein
MNSSNSKDLEKLREKVNLFIGSQFILAPDTAIVHECPNCGTRYALPNRTEPFAQTKIVNFIMDWAKQSSIERSVLWQMIADYQANKEALDYDQ